MLPVEIIGRQLGDKRNRRCLTQGNAFRDGQRVGNSAKSYRISAALLLLPLLLYISINKSIGIVVTKGAGMVSSL